MYGLTKMYNILAMKVCHGSSRCFANTSNLSKTPETLSKPWKQLAVDPAHVLLEHANTDGFVLPAYGAGVPETAGGLRCGDLRGAARNCQDRDFRQDQPDSGQADGRCAGELAVLVLSSAAGKGRWCSSRLALAGSALNYCAIAVLKNVSACRIVIRMQLCVDLLCRAEKCWADCWADSRGGRSRAHLRSHLSRHGGCAFLCGKETSSFDACIYSTFLETATNLLRAQSWPLQKCHKPSACTKLATSRILQFLQSNECGCVPVLSVSLLLEGTSFSPKNSKEE